MKVNIWKQFEGKVFNIPSEVKKKQTKKGAFLNFNTHFKKYFKRFKIGLDIFVNIWHDQNYKMLSVH